MTPPLLHHPAAPVWQPLQCWSAHGEAVTTQLRSTQPGAHRANKENTMSLGNILLIVLILMLVGVIPTWPHSVNWGYWPSGGLGVLLLIVVVLMLSGRL
jgi:hypothetical protein